MSSKNTCIASGSKGNKPAQKRYVAERRLEKNRLKRARRDAKRREKFVARRKAGKRNAYREGRKGRAHRPSVRLGADAAG